MNSESIRSGLDGSTGTLFLNSSWPHEEPISVLSSPTMKFASGCLSGDVNDLLEGRGARVLYELPIDSSKPPKLQVF